ncbi:hypothetical protein PTI98_009442 [Pleurotus ostreatus]|nr:hypothetical protein PTI98_009442 [Pleurotus ostreatus]
MQSEPAGLRDLEWTRVLRSSKGNTGKIDTFDITGANSTSGGDTAQKAVGHSRDISVGTSFGLTPTAILLPEWNKERDVGVKERFSQKTKGVRYKKKVRKGTLVHNVFVMKSVAKIEIGTGA